MEAGSCVCLRALGKPFGLGSRLQFLVYFQRSGEMGFAGLVLV